MNFLINMTMIFTITVMLILIVKTVFRNKFTAKWHVMIWMILIIRLVVPILPESNVSIFNFVPDMQGAYMNYMEQSTNLSTNGMQNNINKKQHDESQLGSVEDSKLGNVVQESSLDTVLVQKQAIKAEGLNLSAFIEKIALIIYWLGVLIMLAGLIISYGCLLKKIKKLPIWHDDKILNIFEICKQEIGVVGHKISLKQGVKSPMLVGVFSPTIYISDGYSHEELKHVIIHELCHYKNKDIIWNIVSTALFCMNWFNPLAWYAFKVFRRDLEMYCDYKAINISGEKKAYAEVLLKTASDKNSFMFATTCLESGEKEVSQRIKRIAYFKQPKVWVSMVGLVMVVVLSVFCLTNAVDFSKKTQVIPICGPQNGWDSYMMEVPLSWEKEYEEVMPDEPPYSENIIFHDKEGTEIAGLTYRNIDLSEYEVTPEDSENLVTMTGTVDYRKKVKALLKEYESFAEFGNDDFENVKIERLSFDSAYIWDVYKVNYLNDSKVIRTEIYLMAGKYTNIIPVLYKASDKITDEELVKAAMTLEKIKDPTEYKPKVEAGWFTDTKKGVSIMGGEYDVKGLLEDYLGNYVNIKMPSTRNIKGYKINSFEEIGPLGDIPGIIDEGMVEGENIPWDIIYPTAKVYKVDYELIPEDIKKYRDVAGGNFEITEKGNKHYAERYAVFYGYSVDAETYEAVFLGFLIDGNLAEWGVDYSVLNRIDSWYKSELITKVLNNAQVQYVGNASAVGKLTGLLPLHEYGNGMELQTKEEPYGITINYKIGRSDVYNPEKGGLLSSWPRADGNLSGIYSKTSPGELNYYIKKQLQQNAKMFVNGIDNSHSTKINCESPYLENEYKVMYSDQ